MKPQIRFKGFTDDWEQSKLGDVGSCQSGIGFPDVEQGGTEGIPFFKVSDMNLSGNEYELLSSNNYVSQEQIERKKWKPITQVPAMFFAKVGAAVMLNRKRLVNTPFLLDNNTMAYIFGEGWDTNFGRTLFDTINLASLVQVGALPSYNAGDVEGLEISLPSIKEQQQIGSYFRNLDNLITLYQRKCETLQKLKKSMLQKMFPKNGELYPEIRFAGFTDAWEQRELGEIVTVGNGMDYKELGEGDIPVYGTGGYMLSVDKALSYEKDAVGIGRKGTIDKPYILKAPFWTVDTLFYCIPKENYDLDFVFGIFQNINWKQKDESTGVPSLSKVNINSTDIKAPSLSEQQQIGTYFRNLDNLITLHQRKLETLKNLKKSMLQKMFI